MNRRKFLFLTGGSIITVGGTCYALSDKSNFVRSDLRRKNNVCIQLLPNEYEILYLASLAPSGHNTQPWFIKRLEPLNWIICNDSSTWLPAVDPTQRETILSIGAFIQNLAYAANNMGYSCQFELVGITNQDEEIMGVKLVKAGKHLDYDTESIKKRRTVRSNLFDTALKSEDIRLLTDNEYDRIHFIHRKTKEYQFLNEQTIEANKLQSYRNAAQKELSEWIRFSSRDAQHYRDGLTTGSMEIEGISGWVVRNFYGKSNVMGKSFRDQNIEQVEKQVSSSGGWFLITSKDNTVTSLIETGMRMQRLSLKVREKNIAIHPMTQILEEPSIHRSLNTDIGINDPVQFILRTGYVRDYPDPVSLRRPIEQLIRY